jgi:hypothetical protein
MLDWLFPSKPPTSSEWAVLLWAFVVLLLAGAAALVLSFFAEDRRIAVGLATYGVRTLAVGAGIGLMVWLVRRFVD